MKGGQSIWMWTTFIPRPLPKYGCCIRLGQPLLQHNLLHTWICSSILLYSTITCTSEQMFDRPLLLIRFFEGYDWNNNVGILSCIKFYEEGAMRYMRLVQRERWKSLNIKLMILINRSSKRCETYGSKLMYKLSRTLQKRKMTLLAALILFKTNLLPKSLSLSNQRGLSHQKWRISMSLLAPNVKQNTFSIEQFTFRRFFHNTLSSRSYLMMTDNKPFQFLCGSIQGITRSF